MEHIEDKKSGFRVRSIVLTESHFDRVANVDCEEAHKDIRFETGVGANGNIINVRLKTLVICKKEDVEQYRIEVSMVGVFERFGDSQIASNEEFGRVNGAAIIFPFVREHISNIAMKAGIGSLILPPVNFSGKFSIEVQKSEGVSGLIIYT